MKNVMIVLPNLLTGGAEKLAVDVAVRVDRTRVALTLVSLYPKAESPLNRILEEAGVRVIWLDKKPGADLRVVRQLRAVIREVRPDVIHTHLYAAPYVLAAAPRRIRKYHTVHNVAEREAEGTLRRIMRFAYRFGNFVPVAISPYCAETIESVYGIPKDSFPQIINGVDTKQFVPGREPEHDTVRFLNVGWFKAQKNQKLLLRSFARVHAACPDTVLEIVGEGELRGELEQCVRDLGLEDAVQMPGSTDRVCERLQAADVFVLSSDFEGLPISALEAMACALPVVTTAAGGVIDIVRDGVNGLVVDVSDEAGLAAAMERLARSSELRAQMGRASRALAETCDIDRCAGQYQALYLRQPLPGRETARRKDQT